MLEFELITIVPSVKVAFSRVSGVTRAEAEKPDKAWNRSGSCLPMESESKSLPHRKA